LSTHLRLGLPCGLFPSGFPTGYSTCIKCSSNITETCGYVMNGVKLSQTSRE
jgi:hypothetical protein